MNSLPKKKVFVILLTFNFLCLSLLATMVAVKRFRGTQVRGEEYQAVFLLNPYGEVPVEPGSVLKVEVYLDPGVGLKPAFVNGAEFSLDYEANQLTVVDGNGNPVDMVTLESGAGSFFEGKTVYPMVNQATGGLIHLAAALLGSYYEGPTAKVASFYVKPLITSGSALLTFKTSSADNHEDLMSIYRFVDNPPFPDILTPLNDLPTSTLTLTVGGVTPTSGETQTPTQAPTPTSSECLIRGDKCQADAECCSLNCYKKNIKNNFGVCQ